MPIILALWFVIAFAGISKNTTGRCPFAPDQTIALRGICAVEIMLGHIGLATGSMILYPNRKAGILFVGIFFVLSGYGVAYSVEHKEDYLKHFMPGRIMKILFPAYLIKLLMIVIEYLVVCYLGEVYTGVSLKNFLIEHNWYVWEQLLFYLLYWLAYKIIPRYIDITVAVISIIFIVVAFVGGMDNPWYGSTLCFALGLYFYKYEAYCSGRNSSKNKDAQTQKIIYYVMIIALFLILVASIAAFLVLGNDSILGNPVARNIASVSFSILVIMLLYKFRIGNSASRFLGRCSYEIFLIIRIY